MVDKFKNPKTDKVVLKIDDEGNEELDEKHFEDVKEKKKKPFLTKEQVQKALEEMDETL